MDDKAIQLFEVISPKVIINLNQGLKNKSGINGSYKLPFIFSP